MVFWILAGVAVSYVAVLTAFFLGRGSHRARVTLVWTTLLVLAFDLRRTTHAPPRAATSSASA